MAPGTSDWLLAALLASGFVLLATFDLMWLARRYGRASLVVQCFGAGVALPILLLLLHAPLLGIPLGGCLLALWLWRRARRLGAVFTAVVALGLVAAVVTSGAARSGPRHEDRLFVRVVDAESGEPVAGAQVVVWRGLAPVGVDGRGPYGRVRETGRPCVEALAANSHGRAVIPARWSLRPLRWVRLLAVAPGWGAGEHVLYAPQDRWSVHFPPAVIELRRLDPRDPGAVAHSLALLVSWYGGLAPSPESATGHERELLDRAIRTTVRVFQDAGSDLTGDVLLALDWWLPRSFTPAEARRDPELAALLSRISHHCNGDGQELLFCRRRRALVQRLRQGLRDHLRSASGARRPAPRGAGVAGAASGQAPDAGTREGTR